MTLKLNIQDGAGKGYQAKVTDRGQLVTAPLEFNTFFNVAANIINTGFNIVPPISGKSFIITLLVIYADKNVGPADASIEVYEASSSTTTTVSASLYKQEMFKQATVVVPNVNVMVSEGKWINVKTDDDIIFINMAGYYVDA